MESSSLSMTESFEPKCKCGGEFLTRRKEKFSPGSRKYPRGSFTPACWECDNCKKDISDELYMKMKNECITKFINEKQILFRKRRKFLNEKENELNVLSTDSDYLISKLIEHNNLLNAKKSEIESNRIHKLEEIRQLKHDIIESQLNEDVEVDGSDELDDIEELLSELKIKKQELKSYNEKLDKLTPELNKIFKTKSDLKEWFDKDELKSIENNKCLICLDAPKEVIFAPCGHKCSCLAHAKRLLTQKKKQCPMCRGNIESFITQVFN